VSQEPTPYTPLTVANICGFNPGLGQVVQLHGTGLVYWDFNGDGKPDFGAYNFEGDSRVDVAFVWDGRQVTYVGFCSPATAWINLLRYAQEPQHSTQQPVYAQGQSSPTQQQQPVVCTQVGQTNCYSPAAASTWNHMATSIVNGDVSSSTLISSPSLGNISPNSGQCTSASFCESGGYPLGS
jgi:hypothetical protein